MALRADDVDVGRDSSLVERFQSGDVAAFEDLYRRYHGRLVRFCLRRVGDPHEAEEVAQEAFARALRALPTLAGERRFYPWMTVIAGRLCVDSHRRRSRTEPADVIDLGAVEPGIDDIFARVDHDYLARAMGRLAPRHQEVLDLRERQGWSGQQIADHYGVNVGTADALLHRARRSLRREFLTITRDAGLLAGVPLLGPLAGSVGRRLTSARDRAAAWAGQVGEMATPLAVKAASVVVAVGSTAVLSTGTIATAGSAAGPARPGGQVVTAPSAAAAAPTAPSHDALAAGRAGAPSGRSAATAPHVNGAGAAIGRAEQGRQAAEGMPIRQESGGTGASIDPEAVTTQLEATILPLKKRLP
jgi:RNA polymerase sigma-70 factor (ECF subfamily)